MCRLELSLVPSDQAIISSICLPLFHLQTKEEKQNIPPLSHVLEYVKVK